MKVAKCGYYFRLSKYRFNNGVLHQILRQPDVEQVNNPNEPQEVKNTFHLMCYGMGTE